MVVLCAVSPPVDGIRYSQASTEAHVYGNYLGAGTLYIAESSVSWISVNSQGFQLQYPNISLHAVSRDTSSFPHHCLYLMLDTDVGGGGDAGTGSGSGSSDEEQESKITEVRFIPSDTGHLDAMFSAMADCQALHPDEEDSFSDDDGYFAAEEDAVHLTEQGAATLARLESMLGAGGDQEQQNPMAEIEPQIGALAVNGDSDDVQDDRHTDPIEDHMDTDQFEDADGQ